MVKTHGRHRRRHMRGGSSLMPAQSTTLITATLRRVNHPRVEVRWALLQMYHLHNQAVREEREEGKEDE